MQILKHDNDPRGVGMTADGWFEYLGRADVVAGNRYSIDGQNRIVPDDTGPWLALETFRGPDAPPRPEVLPVGTRVRRGPDWSWGCQDCGRDGRLTGTVIVVDDDNWPHVRWDGNGHRDCYRWRNSLGEEASGLYDLEVVSLPEPAKAEPWPADAVLWDPDGRHWTDRSTFIYADGRESVAPTSAASVRRSRLIKGRHYQFVTHAGGEPLEEVADASRATWLCVRDFTGPDYREPENPKEKTMPGGFLANGAMTDRPGGGPESREPEPKFEPKFYVPANMTHAWDAPAPRLDKPIDGLKLDKITIGGEVYVFATADSASGLPAADAAPACDGYARVTRHRGATPGDTRGLIVEPRENLQNVCAQADIIPPHIAKARGKTFVVPTDIDDSWIPDADDESMTGRLR